MNIDANVQKIIYTLIRKWKLIVAVTLVGIIVAYILTANFTTLTYTSSVEFLAYAVDTSDELNTDSSSSGNSSEYVRSSNTSKMNYAMRMLDTYIEIMETNGFRSRVVSDMNERLNSDYSLGSIGNSMVIEPVENTAMFKITVTTTDANLSYEIAHQLETTVPEMMKEKNSGLVQASVEDKPIKAISAGSLGYTKKCAIGAIAGFVLAAAYVLLISFLDVRVKSSDELVDRYGIPVLGTVPTFEIKPGDKKGADK